MSTSSTSLSRAGRLSAPALDIQDWGGEFMRYALAIIFLWVGGMKFTDYEAAGIAPFVMNSPLTAWWHSVFGIQGTAYVLGVFEILTGLLLLARPLSALAFLVGALMSIVTYTITLSFLFTTPGVIEPKFDFPLLSPTGVFLLKDIVFLGVSIFLFGQALRLIRDKAEETRAAHLGGINQTRNEVQAAGAFVMRYGLALVFIWFALQKFTAVEADAIAPMIMNSPLLSWMHGAFGIQGASYAVGILELGAVILFLARPFSLQAGIVGAAALVLILMVILTLMLTTPGVSAPQAGGFPALSAETGQLLAKDLVLLGAALLLLGEALNARRNARGTL